MSAKNKVSSSIATLSYEAKSYSMSITNENGIHDHRRNAEHFRGKQKDCPLCKNGSPLEKSLGAIGS
jgi:hypothetical protein